MRLWQVRFEVYRNIPSLPRPGELVDEIQTEPAYRIDGRKRINMPGGQLSYTLEGEGRFMGAGREYRLLPGTAFLHRHNDPETSYYYPQEGSGTWRFLWISFYNESLEKMLTDLVRRYGYIYRLPRDRGIIKRLLGYRNYRGLVHSMTPLAAAKLVMDILAGLGESFEREHENDPQSRLVREAQELIFEKLESSMGVTEIADILNLSREHLSRVFKEQTGFSPVDYILRSKMNFACHLLKNTNLSSKEIALRVGYENSSSFNRAFKKIISISPGELRRIGYAPQLNV